MCSDKKIANTKYLIRAVAQWLEQGTHNPSVVGSIPTGPTMLHIRPQKEKVLAPKRADFSVEQGTFDALQ